MYCGFDERDFDSQIKSMLGGEVMIREITEKDYNSLMILYMQLHDNPMPEDSASV